MKDDKQEIAFAIRVQRDLKDAFLSACESQDQTASQVIRAFMRDYVKKHGQRDLFKS